MQETNPQQKTVNLIKRKIKQRQQRAKNNFWQNLKNAITLEQVNELEYAYFL